MTSIWKFTVLLLVIGSQAYAQPASEPKPQKELKFHAAPKPLAKDAVTQEWRNFLGTTHNAISTETPLLKKFNKKPPEIVWEVERGEGYAAPAVVSGRVLLFHRVDQNEIIECLHAETGQRYWKYSYPTAYRDSYGFSGGPRCQPISDGERVYTFGAEGKLHCLKLTTGAVLWKRDILKEYKLEQNFFGVGATPLLEGNTLIVNVGAPNATAAGFDKLTGKTVWETGKEWTAGYASPIPATINGKKRVFVFTGGASSPSTGGLICLDPVEGKEIFRFPWRARRRESVNASSPVIVGNQVYISECYGPGGALLEVKPDNTFREVWNNRDTLNTHFMTAIHKNGYLYGISGHGPQNAPLVCIELKTGKEMWRAEPDWEDTYKIEGSERKLRLGAGLASMILVDGECLMLTEYGRLVWLDLNPTGYKETNTVSLFLARETWSMPALSRGLLYVSQNNSAEDGKPARLICYDLRGKR